ncbi:hypothetical protein KIL84_009252 [Mauremys mutica]|uniref:Uncharacterized protein n=1 Tax=Mauremys mutica TaxID=74926 RepID=A0A9D3XIL5_9SAUR|nr:hypothetical protein KIL84_009252 [Mauremys mutica]
MGAEEVQYLYQASDALHLHAGCGGRLGAQLGKLDPPIRAVSTVKFNLVHFWLGTQVNRIWSSEPSLRWPIEKENG